MVSRQTGPSFCKSSSFLLTPLLPTWTLLRWIGRSNGHLLSWAPMEKSEYNIAQCSFKFHFRRTQSIHDHLRMKEKTLEVIKVHNKEFTDAG